MATSQRVNTDSLGDFTDVQPEKLRLRGNPRRGIISVQARFYASRDAEFCVSEITEYALCLHIMPRGISYVWCQYCHIIVDYGN